MERAIPIQLPAGRPSALIPGDNIFYGDNLRTLLGDCARQSRGATVFACWVDDPERYGVIEFDASHRPLRIVEKPKVPTSNYAITGLYFYDERVVDVVREMRPSARGELENADLNQRFISAEQLLRPAEPMKTTGYGRYLIRQAGLLS